MRTGMEAVYRLVALLAEGVDRNYKARIAAASWNGRPPRGGHG